MYDGMVWPQLNPQQRKWRGIIEDVDVYSEKNPSLKFVNPARSIHRNCQKKRFKPSSMYLQGSMVVPAEFAIGSAGIANSQCLLPHSLSLVAYSMP